MCTWNPNGTTRGGGWWVVGGGWLVVVVRGRDKWGGVCNETCVCGGLSVRRKGKCEI